jgi:hypothetical protein
VTLLALANGVRTFGPDPFMRSLASYEQTMATALEETEVAFSGYTGNAQRAERLVVLQAGKHPGPLAP